MTDEQVFKTLIGWALDFGCDCYEGEREENEQRRGLFRVLKRVPGRYEEEMEIVIQTDLPLEEKLQVMAHEFSHMGLHLLKLNHDQKLIREPVADLLGRCLIATLKEDWQSPFFKITGIVELTKQFLEFIKAKRDRTCLNLARMNAAYLQWKKEQEGGIGGQKSRT